MNLTLREYAERATELLEGCPISTSGITAAWVLGRNQLINSGIPADAPDAPRRYFHPDDICCPGGCYWPEINKRCVFVDGHLVICDGTPPGHPTWLDTPPPAPDSALVAALREKGVSEEWIAKVKELEGRT